MIRALVACQPKRHSSRSNSRVSLPRPGSLIPGRKRKRGRPRESSRDTGADVSRNLRAVSIVHDGPTPSLAFLVLRYLSISIFRQPGHSLEPLASGKLYTSPKRKRGGLRESSQEHRRRRIEKLPGCPRHSRPIRTPSLALRAGISATTGGLVRSAYSAYQPEAQARGSARELAGRQAPTYCETSRLSASLQADPDPLARASGWYSRRDHDWCCASSLFHYFGSLATLWNLSRPGGFIPARSASEGVRARARRKTGADVLRDLKVVRVTPGPSRPPRSRFGLVFQTRPRLVLRKLSISLFQQPGHALEPLASRRLYTSPKRKRGGLRESSQEHRRRRFERPQGCPRHSRPIRTPSLALRAGISATTGGLVRSAYSAYQPEAQARGSARELAGTQAPTY